MLKMIPAASAVIQSFQFSKTAGINLWIGTDGGGLDLFNKKTKRFTSFQHEVGENSISNNSVGDIREDAAGNLWIGTSSGLNHLT